MDYLAQVKSYLGGAYPPADNQYFLLAALVAIADRLDALANPQPQEPE